MLPPGFLANKNRTASCALNHQEVVLFKVQDHRKGTRPTRAFYKSIALKPKIELKLYLRVLPVYFTTSLEKFQQIEEKGLNLC